VELGKNWFQFENIRKKVGEKIYKISIQSEKIEELKTGLDT